MIFSINVFPPSLEGGSYTQKSAFDDDLVFIQTAIQENHPGVFNSHDPGFSKMLEQNFNIAKQELRQAASDQEKATALQEFGKKFQDAHLWVQYDQKREEIFPKTLPIRETRSFNIQELKQGIHWVDIPTFAP